MPTFTPVLTSDPGSPTYNYGIASTNSWVPQQSSDINRPLFAQATYLVNPQDISAEPVVSGFALPRFDSVTPTYYSNTTNYRTVDYSYQGTLVASLSFSYVDASTNNSPFTKVVRLA